MKWHILRCPMPGLEMEENSSVCPQSHQPGLLLKWNLRVSVGFALKCVLGDSNQTCPRSYPSFARVLLTSPSLSQQL